MNVLVTDATGYFGAILVESLKAAGHAVTGIARSAESAAQLERAGVTIRKGSIDDPASLIAAARDCDGVAHTAMFIDSDAGAREQAEAGTWIQALTGSGRPFLYTSSAWVMGDTEGRLAGEMFRLKPPAVRAWQPAIERMVQDATERKVRGVVLRPAMVFGRGGGIVGEMIGGRMPIVGNGEHHWSFVHVDDLADLYLLALERAAAGSLYIAADGPAVKRKDLAAAAGLPGIQPVAAAREKIGPIADALALDQKIGSTKAFRELGWRPSRPGVLAEIRSGYSG